MAEENVDDVQEEVLDDVLDIQDVEEDVQDNKVEQRIKKLSNKVKLTSKERDELARGKQKLEAERDTAKKEVEFYSAFSDTTDKYPNAKEFKDKIKEKVLLGYSVEDAAVAVLAKEGKLTMPQPTPDNPAGGSAVNLPNTREPKPLKDMSLEEKRAEVIKAVDRGDISLI